MKKSITLKNLLIFNTIASMAIAFMATSYVIQFPFKITIVSGVLLALYLDFAHLPRPPRSILNVASVVVMISAFMRITLQTIIETFTEAIMIMIVVKLLEDRHARDYIQIMSRLVVSVVCSAIVNISQALIYYCFLISFLAGFELLLAAWFEKEPDAVLSFGVAGQLFTRSSIIWWMMLPICLALFFMAPRAAVVMMRQPISGGGQEASIGFSDVLSLGSVRNIQENDAIAFRAEMELIAPKDLYWRGIVLDMFTGTSWLPSRRYSDQFPAGAASDIVRQSIVLEPGPSRWLFALDFPVSAYGDGVAAFGQGIYRREMRGSFMYSKRYEYEAVSRISSSFAPSGGRIDVSRYLSIPDNFNRSSIQSLVDGLLRGIDDDEKPRAVMNYLSPPLFEYSLEDLPMSATPIVDFIFNSRRGNCEFFASAMAVMLRMSNVPARLVAGYHGGVYNDSGGYYIVSQNNAHVWVEAWDRKSNLWRRYDPTPGWEGDSLAAIGNQEYSRLSMYLDVLNYRISRIFMEYDNASQSEALYRIREIMSNPGAAVGDLTNSLGWIEEYSGKLTGLLLAATAAALILHFALRARRKTAEEKLLDGFHLAMTRHGYKRRPCEGLEEFISTMRRGPEPEERLFGLANDFVARFEERYFKGIQITRDDAKYLKGIISRIRKFRES
jgi:transglutaminase-like putative cysteine protease